MKKIVAMTATGWIAAAAFMLVIAPAPALAGGQPQVDWSVSIGSPGYYPPAVVYAPPPVVYVQPQPVYVNPVPVLPYPAPAYVYGRPWGYGHVGHHRHHGRHHHGGG